MTLFVLWWLFGSALGQQPTPAPAQVQQELLPDLGARIARANARADAATSWFSGRSSFEDAWPAYVGFDLLDRSFLRASRRRVASAAEGRAAERVAVLPEDVALAARLASVRDEALDAEGRFAALEDRLLAGLVAGLTLAPALDASQTGPQLQALDEVLAAAGDDAEPEVVQAAQAALAQKTELLAAKQAAVRAMTIPGDPSLVQWAEEVLQVGPSEVNTLAAVRPLLPTELHAAVDALVGEEEARLTQAQQAQRAAALAETQALVESPPPLAEGETVDMLAAAVQLAQAALAESGDDNRALREAELAVAQKRLAIYTGQEAENAAAAQSRADAAREAAEATRAEGVEESQALSALRSRVLAVQSAVAEVYEEEVSRREEVTTRLDGLRATLDVRIETGANAMALSLLEGGRQPAIDGAYLDMRATVQDLYEELDALRVMEKSHDANASSRRRLLDGWGGGRGSEELAKLDDAFQESARALEESLENRQRTLDANRDEVYRLLDAARDNRRVLRAESSSAARSQARRDFFPELRREVSALPGQLAAGGRGVGLALLAVPSFLGDIDALRGLLFGSFELVVLLGLWGVARRQMPAMVGRALTAMRERLGVLFEGDPAAAVAQLAALGRACLDLATGLFVFDRVSDKLGFVGLMVLLWVARAATRAAPLVARSALSSPEDVHPSLRLVAESTEKLAARSLWWLAMWVVLSRLGTYSMVVLLDADRLRDVIGTMSSVAFWVMMAAGVLAWGPVATATLARQAEHSPVTGWAASAAGSSPMAMVLHFPKYLVAIGVVTTQLTVHLFGHSSKEGQV